MDAMAMTLDLMHIQLLQCFGNGVNVSSLSVHTDNRKKDILVLGERRTDGLHDTSSIGRD